MLVDGNDKLLYFTQSMSSLTESLCDCTTAGYLGETTIICDTSFPNEFAIQGRIVGTPTVPSNQIIEQLQNFVSGEPSSIVYQGQTFSYVQRCSVELTTLGRSSCTSVEQSTTIFIPSEKTSSTQTSDMVTNIPYELVGGVAGGVVLLIIIVSVIVIAVLIFKKLGRGRGYGIESKNAVEMEPKAIDIHNVHKSNEEPLYDSIADNPYYKQLNQRYVQDKNYYTSTKKRSNDHDQGEYYMNDGCGPSNEQNYEDMNCGSDQQYNYISTSRKHSTPLGQSVKEQAYTGNTMKQLEVEDYVEMETKLEDGSAYTDLETVQNYETPLSLKDNTLADENVHLSYL